jgi:mono/diheme cytochrome c family protein
VISVYIALGILLVFSVVFAYELIHLWSDDSGVSEDQLSPETYMDVVAPLLENARPDQGAEILQARGCDACHGGENAGKLAPPHNLLAEVAAERRPPLTAAAYIYESIVFPGAFHVQGFPDNMPRIYQNQLTDEELGAIIAYLLRPQTDNG